jgi:predicted DNA-binding protein
MIKAAIMDSTNIQHVTDFNQAVDALQELLSGKKKKKKTPEDVKSIMKDFQENYLKKNLTVKLKNFERTK